MLRYCLVFSLLIIFSKQNCFSQSILDKGKYVYYLFIGGLHNKQDVIQLEKQIDQKEGVCYFVSNRFPVRYFSLRTDRLISKNEFESWLNKTTYKLLYYGFGNEMKENAIMTGIKTKQ